MDPLRDQSGAINYDWNNDYYGSQPPDKEQSQTNDQYEAFMANWLEGKHRWDTYQQANPDPRSEPMDQVPFGAYDRPGDGHQHTREPQGQNKRRERPTSPGPQQGGSGPTAPPQPGPNQDPRPPPFQWQQPRFAQNMDQDAPEGEPPYFDPNSADYTQFPGFRDIIRQWEESGRDRAGAIMIAAMATAAIKVLEDVVNNTAGLEIYKGMHRSNIPFEALHQLDAMTLNSISYKGADRTKQGKEIKSSFNFPLPADKDTGKCKMIVCVVKPSTIYRHYEDVLKEKKVVMTDTANMHAASGICSEMKARRNRLRDCARLPSYKAIHYTGTAQAALSYIGHTVPYGARLSATPWSGLGQNIYNWFQWKRAGFIIQTDDEAKKKRRFDFVRGCMHKQCAKVLLPFLDYVLDNSVDGDSFHKAFMGLTLSAPPNSSIPNIPHIAEVVLMAYSGKTCVDIGVIKKGTWNSKMIMTAASTPRTRWVINGLVVEPAFLEAASGLGLDFECMEVSNNYFPNIRAGEITVASAGGRATQTFQFEHEGMYQKIFSTIGTDAPEFKADEVNQGGENVPMLMFANRISQQTDYYEGAIHDWSVEQKKSIDSPAGFWTAHKQYKDTHNRYRKLKEAKTGSGTKDQETGLMTPLIYMNPQLRGKSCKEVCDSDLFQNTFYARIIRGQTLEDRETLAKFLVATLQKASNRSDFDTDFTVRAKEMSEMKGQYWAEFAQDHKKMSAWAGKEVSDAEWFALGESGPKGSDPDDDGQERAGKKQRTRS